MSRSGYSDDYDYDYTDLWQQAVENALAGKRGQAFLRELIAALDALPQQKLIKSTLVDEQGSVCALGAVGKARGVALPTLEPDEPCAPKMGTLFGIARVMAGEIMFQNDELFGTRKETHEQRFVRMRAWAVSRARS